MATLKFGDTGSCPAMYDSSGGGSGSQFGLTLTDLIGNVDSQGNLIPVSNIGGITFTGVKNINTANAFKTHLVSLGINGPVSFPDLESIGDYGLSEAFYPEDSSFGKSINMITQVNMPKLTSVGNNGLSEAFRNYSDNYKISSINLSALTTIGNHGLSEAFVGSSIQTLDLHSLTTVGTSGLASAFESNYNLTSVDFSSLTSVGENGLYRIFYSCGPSTISFPSLVSIGNNAFSWAFANHSNINVYFEALTPSNISQVSTSAFNDMFHYNSNCVVHFPIGVKSILENWSSVQNGFGGTNTTVLFDLGACETTFSVNPSTNNQIYVDSELVVNNIGYYLKSSSITYTISNPNYGIYVDDYSIPNSDTTTITTDLTNITFNTITLDIGVSGLTGVATVNGTTCNFTETSNGMYSLNIYNGTSNNVTVNYTVYTGASYMDATGTITFSDSDVIETITLIPATTANFVRPNLTSNGTMGGNAFAVDGTMRNPDEMEYMGPWRAVDSDLDTEWRPESHGENAEFIFYNPQGLNVTQLVTKSEDDYYTPTYVVISASNDAQNWNSIGTFTNENRNTTFTMDLTNSGYYRYYKLVMRAEFEIVLQDLAITATQKVSANNYIEETEVVEETDPGSLH